MTSTVAKIYLNNFKHNLYQVKNNLKNGVKLCVAVKADGYGHGAVQCAMAAVECGAEYLAIARVSEGEELRKAGIKCNLLLLSLCSPDEMDLLVQNDITPFVYDEEYIGLLAQSVIKANKNEYPVHLAVDSGMGRVGCLCDEAGIIAEKIRDTKVLKLDGMATHFAVADCYNENDSKYTEEQFDTFMKAVENVKKAGIDPGIIHCSNSVAGLTDSKKQLGMIRLGIVAYGYYPGDMNRKYFEERGILLDLKPVMAFSTKVVSVRDFKKDKSISYGRTFITEKDTKIAVIPVGYADGLFRRFNQNENGLKVTINGKLYPVRGRICMDQCMVEIGTDSDVKRFDEAVIFGPAESGALISAQEIADATGTISYEITCGLSKRVKRIFIN